MIENMEDTLIAIGDALACLILFSYGLAAMVWLLTSVGDKITSKRKSERRRACLHSRRGRFGSEFSSARPSVDHRRHESRSGLACFGRS